MKLLFIDQTNQHFHHIFPQWLNYREFTLGKQRDKFAYYKWESFLSLYRSLVRMPRFLVCYYSVIILYRECKFFLRVISRQEREKKNQLIYLNSFIFHIGPRICKYANLLRVINYNDIENGLHKNLRISNFIHLQIF